MSIPRFRLGPLSSSLPLLLLGPVFAFGLALLLSAPELEADPPAPEEPPPPSPMAEQLDSLMENAFEDRLELDPSFANMVGDPRHRDRLTLDLSEDYRKRAIAYVEKYIDSLGKIDRRQLDPDRRVYHGAFDHWLRSIRSALDQPDRLTPLLPGFGLPATFAQLASGEGDLDFRKAEDLRAFLGRASDFDAWVSLAIENLEIGAEKGIVHPKSVVTAAIRELSYHADAEARTSVFHHPRRVLKHSHDIEPAERRSLAKALESTAAHVLIPAYTRLRDYLRDRYLPQARTSLGLSHLPGGEEWYRQRVRFFTTTDLHPDDIFALGEKEVHRLRGQMRRWQRHLGGRDLHDWSKDDEAVLERFRHIEKLVLPRLAELFGHRPTSKLEIRRVEKARAQVTAGAFYERPAMDGSRPGIFYVNLERGGFDLSTAEVLFLHEGLPGHHFQIALAQERADLPRFLRHGYFGAYVEGWGLYAESLGDELGLYTDPRQKLGAVRYALGRAGRLLGDVGLHHRGWSRGKAENLLRDRGLYWAASELDRYATMPGQALGYMVGFVRLRQLRENAEDALGERFDLRAFHDEILGHGPLPLDVLEAKIDHWIEQHSRPSADG